MPADIARGKGPVYAVDRENGMEMKNGAGKTGAIFLWKNGVKMVFSTASTWSISRVQAAMGGDGWFRQVCVDEGYAASVATGWAYATATIRVNQEVQFV